MTRWRIRTDQAAAMRASAALFGGVVALMLLLGGGNASDPIQPARAAENPPEVGPSPEQQAAVEAEVTQGALRVVTKDGRVVECPLKHTDVKARVSGFVARVDVTQVFHNPYDDRIEAVYVFPLPHEAAIDGMTMVVGDRRIVGVIQRREEARRIYEEAILAGQTAALLEQQRPNIFTQSVGNIDPGQEVRIEISYVDVLKYDMGSYEFHFPMVVGPRYIPGAPISSPEPVARELQGKVSEPVADTNRVPDASKISPPVLSPEFRSGHDIALSIQIDAGVPIENLTVTNHDADLQQEGVRQATVTLSPADSVPNKDFVVRYDVVGEKPAMAMLAHTGNYEDAAGLGPGYFMLMIQPKEDERLTKSPPREMVFLVDVSGSMSGEPTGKVIEAMQYMLKLCRAQDTLQVVTFAGTASPLFEKPVPVTPENVKRALNFTEGLQGGGGTEMLKGVQLAMEQPADPERVRIIVMLTDGYIGNETEIIEHVGQKCGDRIRFWCIGIGQSPNMYLVDGVARQGGGMGKRLGLADDAESLSTEIMTRIQRAQLAEVEMDWGDFQVAETYPARIPELWAGRPVIVYGRYKGAGTGTITVRGMVEGEAVSWPLEVNLPSEQPGHDVLAKIWARQKIESLMQQTFYQGSPAVEEEVTNVALRYRLMSPYTSFVAVDAENVPPVDPAPRPPRRVQVPVPLPEGTQWEGFFGPQLGEPPQIDALTLGLEPSSGPVAAGPAGGGLKVEALHETPSGRTDLPRMRSLSLNFGRGLQRAEGRVQREAGLYGGGGMGGAPTSRPSGAVSRYGVAGAEFGQRVANGYFFAREGLAEDKALGTGVTYSLAVQSLAPTAGELEPVARETLMAAERAEKERRITAARSLYQRAYLLSQAAQPANPALTETATQALAAIERIDREQQKEWQKHLPVLAQRLDLILRRESLPSALQTLGKAANLSIDLLPGSVDDAAALHRYSGTDVDYVDLRQATVAQSLNWVVQPLGLTWWVEDDRVKVGSGRRSADESSWVYEVARLVLPTSAEMGAEQDPAQQLSRVQGAQQELLRALHEHLQVAQEERALFWLAPGQLVFTGTADQHLQLDQLLEQLADPTARVNGPLADLHRTTSKRAAEREEKWEQQRADYQRHRIVQLHESFCWPLLAAAAAGRVDMEALTMLQIGWEDPLTGELLRDERSLTAFRSLWAVTQASRALPDNAELKALVAKSSELAQAAVPELVQRLEKDPQNAASRLAGVYALLAYPQDQELREKVLAQVARQTDDPLAVLVRLLTDQPRRADLDLLRKIVEQPHLGNDLVVLTAMASRRAGESSWQFWRAHSGPVLGQQPLSGDVLVLVNRLGADMLPLVARR